MAEEVYAKLSTKRGAISIAIGLVAGIVAVLLPYGAVWLVAVANGHANANSEITSFSGFNASLTLLLPMVQGVAMGVALGRERYKFGTTAVLTSALMAIELFVAAIFLREGVICLIILSPLLFGAIWLGALLGRAFARRDVSRTIQVSLLPLVAFAVLAEANGPSPNYTAEVRDSVIVDAPPEYVWRYVMSYPENRDPPEYWLWQIGLPYPTQSVAETPIVGAKRICAFNTGIAFEERIVELTPNESMTFEVTAQPDHPEVTGHFQFDRGQIRLTRNADGTTTLTATSWYRLFVRPAPYFNWWTEDITRQVHFRVLNHMRGLAEEDYQAAQAPRL